MAFSPPLDKHPGRIRTVTFGATAADGGTRARTVTVGGANAMPFHRFEGDEPFPPVLAMEVYDRPPGRYPPSLREVFGDDLADPAAMAKRCVAAGAAVINVRLEATHPEKGDLAPEAASEVVGAVLAAVDVPLMVSAHTHYEKANAVLRRVAEDHAGERLLLAWVENENYRTIAAACLAYGHCLVAQSPIDFNIAKQLNILLTNMDVPAERIVMDPTVGALGYGNEYTYSVMERLRLAALSGDAMLQMPMVVPSGWECLRTKEAAAPAADQPAWGDPAQRLVAWELATAGSLLLAGGDLVVVAHPETASRLGAMIADLGGVAVGG